jgi:hypothetical protein
MDRYFTELAAEFVRGRLGQPATIADGLAGGLQLHKFKQNTELPRVQRVLAITSSYTGPFIQVRSSTIVTLCASSWPRTQ